MSVIAPRKSLGQNFLQDGNIIRKIVAAIAPQQGDVVLEIGPGTGALTKELAGTCRLTAVEIDARAVELLRATFGHRVDVREGSVLDVDLHAFAREAGAPVRVVGNIPYNLTSEILFWIFDAADAVRDATLMIQDEVADRLIAQPRTKEYGILSVCSQHYATPKRLFGVSRSCFYPVPDVDSAVVSLSIQPRTANIDDGAFRTLVRSTFGKRRKTIRNGLSYLGLSKSVLDSLGDITTKRPEELSAVDFAELAKRLMKL